MLLGGDATHNSRLITENDDDEGVKRITDDDDAHVRIMGYARGIYLSTFFFSLSPGKTHGARISPYTRYTRMRYIAPKRGAHVTH